MDADLFMFMGQSNMAGRGAVCARWPEGAPALVPGAGWEFRAVSDPTRLYPLSEPFGAAENRPDGICEDLKSGSMATSFANAYFERTGVPVVGVSASKGGSSILEWQPGGAYLEDALSRLRGAQAFFLQRNGNPPAQETDLSVEQAARRAGAVSQGNANPFAQETGLSAQAHGVQEPVGSPALPDRIRNSYLLWCQGETDGDHGMSAIAYVEYFARMLRTLLDAGLSHCFMVRIGRYNGSGSQHYGEIRQAQEEIARSFSAVTMVSRSFYDMQARGLMKDDFHYYQTAYNEVGAEAGRNAAAWVLGREELL